VTISQERIETVSRESGFREETVKKVLYMLEFLRAFSDSPISNKFALIGGTAINLPRPDIPRLSEDIDLDFVGDPRLGTRDDTLESIKKGHVTAIQSVASKLGWSAALNKRQSTRRDATLYVSAPAGVQVEVNLSYRYCHSVFGAVPLPLPRMPGDHFGAEFRIQSLCKEELWASKLVASVQDKPPKALDWLREPQPRVKARHIYDTYWLSKNLEAENLEADTLRKCFVLFGVSRMDRFSWYRGEIIQFFDPRHVRRYVLPMVRRGESVLELEDAAWQVRKFLDKRIYGALLSEEYEFLEAWEHRAFTPLALFPAAQYPGVADRLREVRYYDEIRGKLVGDSKRK